MWRYVAKIIAENGEISSSEAYGRYQDAQVFAWRSKDDPVSIVITQIDESGRDVMDHWLKRLSAPIATPSI
jgi:hypothetical protein